MTQVFLNHKTEEKKIVLSVKHYLSQCLISGWLDSEDIPGGSKLNSEIIDNIAMSHYFIAFISRRYLGSNWCMHELEEAQRHALDDNVIIIPVLLDSKDNLELNRLDSSRKNMIESILQKYKYIQYDQYDTEESNRKIAYAIGKHNKIQFDPIIQRTIREYKLQLIQFQITANDGNLPTDFLSQWGINVEKNFLAHHDSDKEKPLRTGKAIAFSGQGPNWLYVYLAVPFKNLCPIYIFNNRSEEYICVYDLNTATPGNLGIRCRIE